MIELKEKHKILIMVFLLAIASFLTYYFLAVLRIANVFTHFFYIPIVLAALWWKRKGMVVAIFLAVLLLLGNIFIKNMAPTYDDAIWAFMFMVIAFLVVLLSEKIEKSDEELKKHQEHLEDMVNERTAELRNTNKQFQHEITKRKQMGDMLHRQQEEQEIMFDSVPAWIFFKDKENRFIRVNKTFAGIMGMSKEDLEGRSLFDLYPKEQAEAFWRDDEEVISSGPKMGIIEHVEIKKEIRWTLTDKIPYRDAKGDIIGIIGFAIDITERKRSIQALAESEEKFKSLFDNATDGIMLAEIETKKQYMANKMMCQMLGYSLEEIKNLSVKDIHPEKDMPWIIKMFEEQAKGEISLIENIPVKRKDGTVFYVDINTSPVNIGGKLYNLGIFRDITERRRNEEMRRENERLVFANRAKSEFLMVMSHELRTPLNAILGFTELLKQKSAGELNEKQQRYADNVHSSGKHLLSVIDDILDITKVESGKMEINIENVSVPKIINESAEIIKEKAATQNVRIIKQTDPEIEFIETDENKFRQVLNNLLSNALKFSKPEGGKITITVVKEGDKAKFSVVDTGIGIKEEDMGRLFQSFEQMDTGITRKYGGTGLGLAVSKKLLELIGGSITAESRYGEGSTFTFTLPIKAKKQEHLVIAATNDASLSKRRDKCTV